MDAEKDLGVALVDIGGGTTDVAVFTGGEIYYTAVLPVGGNHVTNDIAVGLRASQEEAEKTKIKFGAADSGMVGEDEAFEITSLGAETPRELPRELLVNITEPRMQEILQMVRAEIMKSGYLEMLPAGAVLTGGASQMPGMAQLAERILGMPVRLGLPRDVGGLSDTVASPVYATAVGLVIYAAKHQADLHGQEKTATLKRGILNFFRRLFG